MSTPSTKPTVVLVHGAWGDGSSWQKVIPFLLKKGIAVVAVQNPTSSLADDAAATRRIMNTIEGPIVLVGHSWGGAVITEAGNDPKVKALVYVAAFAPKAGESVGEQVGRHAAPPALSQIRNDGAGYLTMSEEGWTTAVAQDLSKEEAQLLSVLQAPLSINTFDDKVTETAWQSRPTWYIVSTEDRAVSVDLQRDLAEMMGAKTTELKASHMSPLSKPDAVSAVILEAVAAVEAS